MRLVELVFFELFVDDQLMINYYYFHKRNSYIFPAVVIMVNKSAAVVVSCGIDAKRMLLIAG